MKVFKLIVGYILNAILGFVYYPLIEYAVTLIQGTVNGPAYTIQEPELSSYKSFGVIFLMILTISLIISQMIIKIFLYKEEKKQYYFSIVVFVVFMILAVFLVE